MHILIGYLLLIVLCPFNSNGESWTESIRGKIEAPKKSELEAAIEKFKALVDAEAPPARKPQNRIDRTKDEINYDCKREKTIDDHEIFSRAEAFPIKLARQLVSLNLYPKKIRRIHM